MPAPFPGMDPYIERPAIWADFHDRLIICIQAYLMPLLRPNYVALVQDRLFVVDSDRPIYPDVSVLSVSSSGDTGAAKAAVLEADAPAIFKLRDDKVRQPYLQIIEPAAGNRIVTAIEVLSPDNKSRGDGRRSYLQKRTELWHGRANIVEIDLLRAGAPTVNVTESQRILLRPWHYMAVVLRRRKRQREVYPILLTNRLPRIKVPLRKDDADVTLDLQAAFTRCYEEGPYPGLLHYDEPPPGEMTGEDVAWCVEKLRTAKLRV